MARSQKNALASPELKPVAHDGCRALGKLLDRIGDKWTIMIVGVLSNGPMRFNALRREIDTVSHRMLTLTLRAMEEDGLVKRTVYPTVPPKVEYRLTEIGRSLIEPLEALSIWAEKNLPTIEAARAATKSRADVELIGTHANE